MKSRMKNKPMNELIGRAYLEQAIEKAQKRNAARIAGDIKARAERARDDAAMFIAENPFAAVAGGLVLGIAIGAMLPKVRGGRAIRALIATATDAGVAYGREAWDAAMRMKADHELAGEEKDS